MFISKFGFSVNFFCVVLLLYLHNILITINFDILKYIKKYLKYQYSIFFNAQQRTTPKKSIKNLDSSFLSYESGLYQQTSG